MYDISFPHLGIVIRHLVSGIDVFGFRIAFYGIIMGCAMLAGLEIACRLAKMNGEDPDLYTDFFVYCIIFSIIAARAYYVIFSWDMYKDDPIQIFNLRAGGIAMYGSIIGGLTTMAVFSKIKKVPFLQMADRIMPGVLFGQVMGRWGNFFNCEAFGGYTDSLLAMRIRLALVGQNMLNEDVLSHTVMDAGTEYIQVHPTFLYESALNLCFFFWLYRHCRKQQFTGEIFWLYLGGYGLIRALVEGLRTDSLMIPGTPIRVSQLVAILCALTAAAVLRTKYKKSQQKP